MEKKSSPQSAADRIKRLSAFRPKLAIVLGSGFQAVSEEMKLAAAIPYAKLPGFPPAGVSGHAGQVLIGHLGGTAVIVLSGRAHYYEGHSMPEVTFGVRTMASYGVQDLLLTNAAGGINRSFRPGDFMILRDHINLMGTNPLIGPPWPGLPRFVDLSCAYEPRLIALLHRAGRASNIKVRSGVYLAVSGPNYETPAEIGAFARLGADAVGMSTVPEVIVARQLGLRVAALSCITNLAAGRSGAPLSHTEVLKTGERVKVRAANLLKEFARLYHPAS